MIGGGLGISAVSLSPVVGPPCEYHQSRNCRKKLPTSRLKVRILAVVLTDVMARWVRPWLSFGEAFTLSLETKSLTSNNIHLPDLLLLLSVRGNIDHVHPHQPGREVVEPALLQREAKKKPCSS